MIKTIFNHKTNEIYMGEVVDCNELLKQPDDGWSTQPLAEAATAPTLAKGSLTPAIVDAARKGNSVQATPTLAVQPQRATPTLPPSEAAISANPPTVNPVKAPLAVGTPMPLPEGTGTGERVAPDAPFGKLKGATQQGGTRSKR